MNEPLTGYGALTVRDEYEIKTSTFGIYIMTITIAGYAAQGDQPLASSTAASSRVGPQRLAS